MWKQDPCFCCIQDTHLNIKDRHYLRAKGWETIVQANEPKKKTGEDILTSNKIDFKSKLIKRIGEGYFIVIQQRKNPQDDILIIPEHKETHFYFETTTKPTTTA